MDVIHLILGQNGRPGRSGDAPPAASAGVGAAFSSALASLEGKHAKEATGDAEASDEDDAAVEEATVEDLPAEESENDVAAIPVSVEEEAPPLASGEALATAMPADDSTEGETAVAPTVPTARAVTRTAIPSPHPFAEQAVFLAQREQQGPPALPNAPAVEAPIPPDIPEQAAARSEAPRSAEIARTFLPNQAGTFHRREAGHVKPPAIDLEAAVEPRLVSPEGEAAEVMPSNKPPAPDRPLPQFVPSGAFDSTATSANDAKVDEGGMRALTEGISMAPTDSGPSPSRSTPAAPIMSTSEARPVLHSIAEASVRAQDGTIELRLSPEELGRVRISMSHQDLGLTVVLSAERDDTLALLRRHASELAAALRDAGLGEATIEFADRERPSSQDSQRRAPGQVFGALTQSGTDAEHPTLRASGDGALDIRM